jgi:histidyl-tRNA synthetase
VFSWRNLADLPRRKVCAYFPNWKKMEFSPRKVLVAEVLKSQLKIANRLGVELTLILGQKETLDGTVIIKNMTTGVQETVSMEKLVDIIKKKLKTDNVVVYHNHDHEEPII